MKFTAQEEYGLRCVLNLARAYREEAADSTFMTVGAIAEKEGLSVQYAGKLFRVLAKCGLVDSVRGCKGGYRLTRPPSRVSVGDVLSALGAKLYEPRLCDRYVGDRSFCVHTNDCSIRSLWGGLQLIIDAVLEKTTLADLIEGERPMTVWIAESLAEVSQMLEARARETRRAAGSELAGPGFSGREIPVLREDHQRVRLGVQPEL
jgi:Rrf2 family protein